MKKLFLLAIICAGLTACADKQNVSLTIFHTNDIQGFYWDRNYAENDNKLSGGFAVLKNMLAARQDDYLLFDSGDTFSGTQEGQLGKLEGAIKIMNRVGYSAATLSAADFALGSDLIEPALAKAEFPIVVSNIEKKDGTPLKNTKKFIIIKKNNLKIAVLGVVSKGDFPAVQRTADLQIADEIDSIRNLLPQLRQKNVNLIILLSSLGLEVDSDKPRTDEKNIAEEIPEINLILGGNAELSSTTSEQIAKTFITRAEPMLSEVAKTTVTFNKNNMIAGYKDEAIVLDEASFGKDAAVQELIDHARNAVKKITGRRITTLIADMDNAADKPSSLGSFTAQCIRRWGHTDIGIINSDAFVTGLKQGPLTEVDLQNSVPYNDRVMFLNMRGDEFKNALEYSLEAKSNWPQSAGLNVVYNPKEPLGSKIKKITVNGQPLVDGALYSISASDHIVAGGFGHDEFLNVFEFKNTDRTVRDIMRWCFYMDKNLQSAKPDSWKELK